MKPSEAMRLVGRSCRHLKYGDGKVIKREWIDRGIVYDEDRPKYGPAIVAVYRGGYEHFLQFHNGQFNEYHFREIVLL